jgi:hypothetical protein
VITGRNIKSDQTNVNLVKGFEYHSTLELENRYTNVTISVLYFYVIFFNFIVSYSVN